MFVFGQTAFRRDWTNTNFTRKIVPFSFMGAKRLKSLDDLFDKFNLLIFSHHIYLKKENLHKINKSYNLRSYK